MKINIILISAFFLVLSNISAQNSGYLGQKNIVEINSTYTVPLISNLLNFGDNQDNNPTTIHSLDDKKDRLDIGYGISYLRVLNHDFAVGLFIGRDHFSALPGDIIRYKTDEFNYNNTSNYYGEIDFLDFTTFTIMPKIEFSKNSTILPVGFSHQIGFGIKTISLNERTYKSQLTAYPTDYYYNYTLTPISSIETSEFNDKIFDFSKNKFKAKTIMYALNMRTPISDRLLINYGFQYTFNFMNKSNYFTSSNSNLSEEFWFTHDEINDLIRSKKQFSFILFNLGLSVSF